MKDIIVTASGKNITPQFIENKLKFSPYINDAVVIGERKKYLTCLIVIDEDNVVKYAQENKVPLFDVQGPHSSPRDPETDSGRGGQGQ